MNFRFMATINSQLLMSLLQMGSIRLLVTFKYHRKDFNASNFKITRAKQSPNSEDQFEIDSISKKACDNGKKIIGNTPMNDLI